MTDLIHSNRLPELAAQINAEHAAAADAFNTGCGHARRCGQLLIEAKATVSHGEWLPWQWFRRLDEFPRCFVHGRLTFANADNPAPFPSALFYLGKDVAKFHRAFSNIGGIFVRLDAEAA